jgi:hypothetical protein
VVVLSPGIKREFLKRNYEALKTEIEGRDVYVK